MLYSKLKDMLKEETFSKIKEVSNVNFILYFNYRLIEKPNRKFQFIDVGIIRVYRKYFTFFSCHLKFI